MTSLTGTVTSAEHRHQTGWAQASSYCLSPRAGSFPTEALRKRIGNRHHGGGRSMAVAHGLALRHPSGRWALGAVRLPVGHQLFWLTRNSGVCGSTLSRPQAFYSFAHRCRRCLDPVPDRGRPGRPEMDALPGRAIACALVRFAPAGAEPKPHLIEKPVTITGRPTLPAPRLTITYSCCNKRSRAYRVLGEA